MRERSRTLRRGPKHPLPAAEAATGEPFSLPESNYYTIDNTEEIYGTNLLPSQRCYVDPWDLENYDYVRKKIASSASPPPTRSSCECYETSLSPSPAGEPISSKYYYLAPQQMEEEIYHLQPSSPSPPINSYNFHCCSQMLPPKMAEQSSIYGTKCDNNYNLMINPDDIDLNESQDYIQDPNVYSGYGGFSTSSSTGHNSSCGDEIITPTIMRHKREYRRGDYVGVGAKIASKRSASKLEYPVPVPLPMPAYDYCNPYARVDVDMLPYASVSDCYECLTQHQHHNVGGLMSPRGGATSMYGTASIYGSTLGRRNSSSVYSSGYVNKFGLSKKGLLQIDYSYSWHDLDRQLT